MLFRSITDDDIFISYTHYDASTYAAGLADELTKKGFSCFIDRLGTEPGKDLPGSLRRKIRGCAMLVVVATERAGTRKTIEDEIKEFLRTGRQSSIVVVDFGGAVYKARWYGLVEGIAPEPEKNPDALDDGNPSPPVLGRIEKQFNYTRRDRRLRQVTVGTAALLVFLIMASVVAGVYARQQIASAREAGERAEQARAEARGARSDAERARAEALRASGEAEQARAEAEAARDEAKRATSVAARQQRRATQATREARRHTRLAADASARALEATAAVKQQEGIALGRKVAASADTLRARAVRRSADWAYPLAASTLLSVEAARRLTRLGVPPAESDRSLRDSLDLLPRSARPFERAVEDVLISADGKYFVTKEGDFVRAWDTASFRQLSDDIKLDEADATFNLDRTLMVLIGKDRRVSVRELPSGKLLWTPGVVDALALPDKTPALHISPDGKYIAASIAAGGAAPSHSVVVWDARSGARVTEVGYKGGLYGMALNPGRDLLALSLDAQGRQAQTRREEARESVVQFWAVKSPAALLFETKNNDNDGPLHALCFSPSGKLLAVAGNNRASLLEVGGGREFTPIEGIRNVNRDDSPYIYKLSFSPDGKSVGAMRKGIEVDTWDVLLGMKLWGGFYNNEGWSYERPYVVTLGSGGLNVIDATTGRDIARLFSSGPPAYGADYAPSAKLLAVNFEERVLIYDIGSAQEASRVTPGGGGQIAHRSSDRRHLILKDDSRHLLWDSLDSRGAVPIEDGGGIDALAFSPDGSLLAFVSTDNSLRVLETGTGREIWRAEGVIQPQVSARGRRRPDLSLSFSPRSGFVVLETFDGKTAVRVYSLAGRREVAGVGVDARHARRYEENVSFTPDEKFVLLRDTYADSVFDTADGRLISTLPKEKGDGAAAFAADNTHLAQPRKDVIEVSGIVTGRASYKVRLPGGVSSLAFSSDGKVLAAVGGGGGHLWDAATGAGVKPLGISKGVNFIRFSPDNEYLVLIERRDDRYPHALVGVLNVASGHSIIPSRCGDKITFSADGKRAVTTQGAACLIDLAAGRVVTRLIHDGDVLEDVVFSADGSLFATASGDRVAHVWEMKGGREVARLPHESDIASMAFESGGRLLATVTEDRTARSWIIREDELIRRACERLNQTLSREEWEQNFGGEEYNDICPGARGSSDTTRTDNQ